MKGLAVFSGYTEPSNFPAITQANRCETRMQAVSFACDAAKANEHAWSYWKMFEPQVPGFVHLPTCCPYRLEASRTGETVDHACEFEETILRKGPTPWPPSSESRFTGA